jgi:predicted transcriptional regulator
MERLMFEVFWTAQRVQRVQELRAQKMTFSEIAELLDVSRNAIASIVRRKVKAV